jgi:uncharacterized protein (TIGR01777 family)
MTKIILNSYCIYKKNVRELSMDLDTGLARRVLLSGASGMLGSAVGKTLDAQQIEALRLVRREPESSGELHWNPSAPGGDLTVERLQELQTLSAAIHLSGANVSSRRWTKTYKQEMRESRVDSTRVLSEALARLKEPPPVLICASAVGFYGDRGDQIVDEDSGPGNGYFPELCQAWEAATRPAEDAGIRVVHARFAMVLGPDGGALAPLAPLFKLGLGGKIGNGRQWMSWVSEADAAGAVLFAMNNPKLSGPVNIASPNPVTNAEFTRLLGEAVHRPAILPAPAFALRLAFGEMADEALLASTRAIPKRLLDAGYVFQHANLPGAFAAALAK